MRKRASKFSKPQRERDKEHDTKSGKEKVGQKKWERKSRTEKV